MHSLLSENQRFLSGRGLRCCMKDCVRNWRDSMTMEWFSNDCRKTNTRAANNSWSSDWPTKAKLWSDIMSGHFLNRTLFLRKFLGKKVFFRHVRCRSFVHPLKVTYLEWRNIYLCLSSFDFASFFFLYVRPHFCFVRPCPVKREKN